MKKYKPKKASKFQEKEIEQLEKDVENLEKETGCWVIKGWFKKLIYALGWVFFVLLASGFLCGLLGGYC